MEIERKFTITQLPKQLADYPCHLIEQAYLNTNPVIRIRREDDRYYMTYKGEGLMAREEYNLPLNAESYAHLLPKADGNVISKKRYLIPIDTPCFSWDTAIQTPIWRQAAASPEAEPAPQAAASSSGESAVRTAASPSGDSAPTATSLSGESAPTAASPPGDSAPRMTAFPSIGSAAEDWHPVIELDVFAAPFDGLIIAEVEFPSIEAANAFIPPAWFEKDVTSDPAYHNSNLSRQKTV